MSNSTSPAMNRPDGSNSNRSPIQRGWRWAITDRRRFAQQLQRPALIALLLLTLSIPYLGSAYTIFVATQVLIYIPLVIGQNLVTGNAGMLAMGQAVLYGIGAYTTGYLAIAFGMSTPIVLFASIVAAATIGVLVALTAIRVNDDYLFIVTLGLNLIFLDVVNQAKWTGGAAGLSGIPSPAIGPVTINNPRAFFYLVLAACLFSILIAYLMTRSRLGTVISAIRDDPLVISTIGVRSGPVKVGVFGVGGAMAGLSGCMLAYSLTFVGPQDFTTNTSLLIFEMMIIGGLARLWGSIAGALLLILVPELLRPIQEYSLGIGGAILIALMITRPQGLFGERSLGR